MESNKLTKLDNKIPIKSIPEQELNRIIIMEFTEWIADLLSLTDEISAKRLEIALPAIKEHCWSMGFDEIKKMFEMYVDNKLALKPIPNYFDRILLGKILIAYKQQKKMNRIDENKEKRIQDDLDTITCFDSFVQDNKIHENNYWIFTYLETKGIINYTKDEKRVVIEISKQQAKNSDEVVVISKTKLLERFFGNITTKGKHIKDFL